MKPAGVELVSAPRARLEVGTESAETAHVLHAVFASQFLHRLAFGRLAFVDRFGICKEYGDMS